MSEQTRRAFVKRSATAAVGATVIGALVTAEADAAYIGTGRGLRTQRAGLGHDRRPRGHRPRPQAGRADHSSRRQLMSSHREAPAISKDPVADNTDTYAFVSPDDPDTVTIIANYMPLEAPSGGPNFFEFGDDVRYEIHIDNDGDGKPDDHIRVPVPDRGPQPGHVPLQHRPDRLARQPELEPAAVLHGHARRRTATAQVLGERPGLPAVQHRAGARRRTTRALADAGGPHARRRPHGVRRPAARGVLRRPRRDLRPRRPAAVPEPAPRRRWPARARASTRTHDFSVHTIALQVPKHELTRDGSHADRPDVGKLGDRRLGRGQPAQGALIRDDDGTAPVTRPVTGSRCRGWATRCSTR